MPPPRPQNDRPAISTPSPCSTVAARQPAQASRSSSSVSLLPGTSTVGVSITTSMSISFATPRCIEPKSPAATTTSASRAISAIRRAWSRSRWMSLNASSRTARHPSSAMSLLSELTTLRLGGPAARIVEARTQQEAVDAVQAADAENEPLLVLAGGSNVVVADDGFPGTVVRMLTSGIEELEENVLNVQAGEPWDPFVERAVNGGLAGIECLSGIP